MPSPAHPVLRIRKYSTPSVLGRAYAIDNGFSADQTRFAGCNPPLLTLQDQIKKVEDWQKQAKSNVKGAAKQCAVERERLATMLESERVYVRGLCEATPDQAAVIIQAAGMVSSAVRVTEQPILKVTQGTASGTVDLKVAVALLMGGSRKTRRGKFFNWQYTLDGGKTFIDAPSTPGATTTIGNLTPLTTVGFRVKLTTIADPGEWSQMVSMLVH